MAMYSRRETRPTEKEEESRREGGEGEMGEGDKRRYYGEASAIIPHLKRMNYMHNVQSN